MRIGGLASGMDINQLVQDLMRAERMPLDKLFQKKQWVDWQRDAYRDVNLSLSKFRDSMSNLRLQSTFIAYGVNSSHQANATATATANASPGTHQVVVHSLAEVAKLRSENEITNTGGSPAKAADRVLAAGGTETFTLTNGAGKTATITVTDEDTYSSLAKKINDAVDSDGKSLGIRASFDNTTSRFFFSTKDMGSDQGIQFENTTFVQNQILGGGSTFSASGADGRITFDGIEIDNLKTNSTTVNGMNISLVRADPATTITLSVRSNTDAVFNSIKDFVTNYNNLIDELQGKLNEPRFRDFPPLTDEQRRAMSDREVELWDERAKSGLLRNDPILREVMSSMRRSFSDPVSGIPGGQMKHLSELGITTGNYLSGGKLVIDENKLRKALTEKPDEVMALFTKASDSAAEKGISRRIYDDANKMVDQLRKRAGLPGTTSADQSTLGKSIRQLNNQIFKFEDRLARVENRYWRQFGAMEKALNNANQQSMWMMQNMFGGN
ncbi:flagellar hook-associated protein 2 [Caldalkalibacillus mannanilyticus]|uniref:flagellar hook-associated protein 2 n=1 Tax=Caldalkalibacillus mannanilyticus TaxID=1418 RepID=UPI00046804E9|nr:flagellar hook-associated protein 2 [Caldalkalibacillus mannanilyticus]